MARGRAQPAAETVADAEAVKVLVGGEGGNWGWVRTQC